MNAAGRPERSQTTGEDVLCQLTQYWELLIKADPE
jgi:hypothetical protein